MTSLAVFALGPYGFAGASRAMVQYLRALTIDKGFTASICSYKRPFALAEHQTANINWVPVSAVHADAIGAGRAIPGPDALATVELADAVVTAVGCHANNKPVVVWSHYLFPYAEAAALATSILRSRGLTCAFVVTPCGSDIWQIAPQLEEVTRSNCLLRPPPDLIIVYSPRFLQEVLTTLHSPYDYAVIPPPIDTALFRPDKASRRGQRRLLGIPDDALVLISHSNMRPVKGVDRILAAAKAFAGSTDAQIFLLLVGPSDEGVERTGNLVIHRLGLRSNLESLLPAADIFLNLSSHDSFNLAAAEAMSCGLSVVTTDVIGLLDYIPQPSSIGATIDSSMSADDIKANVVRALKRLQGSTIQRRHCGENNRKFVENKLSPVKVAEILKDTFATINPATGLR